MSKRQHSFNYVSTKGIRFSSGSSQAVTIVTVCFLAILGCLSAWSATARTQRILSANSATISPRIATATATVVNGFVVGITLLNGGSGYDAPPKITLSGGNGSGANAVAVVTDGIVTEVKVISTGSDYSSVTMVTIDPPVFSPTMSIKISKVSVKLELVAGLPYVLESSDDLINWTQVGYSFIAQDSEMSLEFEVEKTGRNFRLISIAPGNTTYSQLLINVDFGTGTKSSKLGFAATGITANDFWNLYAQSSSLPNLKMWNGTNSEAGINVDHATGAFGSGAADPMLAVYRYPPNLTNIVATITNLPSGRYDFYVYGHGNLDSMNGIFSLTTGGALYGTNATTTESSWRSTTWTEGQQYVRFNNVSVMTNQFVEITSYPRSTNQSTGVAVINGLQIRKR